MRYSRLNENVTHVVMGTKQPSDVTAVKELNNRLDNTYISSHTHTHDCIMYFTPMQSECCISSVAHCMLQRW